jgi:glucose-1-phosphate thymidylyltransferase
LIVVEDIEPRGGIAQWGGTAALAQVANRPIVHHVLDALGAVGLADVVVASSTELAEEVRACVAMYSRSEAFQLTFLDGPGPLDLLSAARLAIQVIGDAPCVAHLASGLLSEPLSPLIDRLDGGAPQVVAVVHQGPSPDMRLSRATQELLHVAELDPKRAGLGLTGVLLFGSNSLRCLEQQSTSRGEMDLVAAAESIGAMGGSLQVVMVDGWTRYAGAPRDLLEVNRIALDRIESGQLPPPNRRNHFEGPVHVDESASVRDSVIIGPTAIAAGAYVADAYIGPYTSIGAGARIEGAEIERSIVASGASILHTGGRLASSIVGRDARVFRDFSVPRAMRLRVGDGTEVVLC